MVRCPLSLSPPLSPSLSPPHSLSHPSSLSCHQSSLGVDLAGGSQLGEAQEHLHWDVLKDGYITKNTAASSAMLDWEEKRDREGDSNYLEDSYDEFEDI